MKLHKFGIKVTKKYIEFVHEKVYYKFIEYFFKNEFNIFFRDFDSKFV